MLPLSPESTLPNDDPFDTNVRGGYITTFTGKHFSFTDPRPDMVSVEDIAHHLSQICHWNGACRSFFSVAQHSVLVAKIAPPELKKWALMHDAAEAYVGDMTRPLKVLLPQYKVIEQRVKKVIAEVFLLPWPEPPELKHYDDQILKLESQYLMHENECLHDGRGNPVSIPSLSWLDTPPIAYTTPMMPLQAEAFFIRAYDQLFLDDDGL